MRIDESQATLQHPGMDEHIADALLERATDLTYAAFGEKTTEDHIDVTYERLVVNWLWGAGVDGAVTVH